MLPDPSRYEARYRLTTGAVPVVAATLVMLGVVLRTEALWAAGAIIAAALAVLLVPAVAARRLVAFRADYAGLMLGAEPRALMVGRRQTVFIPWYDVDKIVLHPDQSGLPGAEGLLVVTPGVRLADAARDDHRRAGTPAEAIAAGADYLVVGRPIIESADPAAMAARIIADMESAL